MPGTGGTRRAFDLPELLNGLTALADRGLQETRRGHLVLSGTIRGCAVVEFGEGAIKIDQHTG